MNLSEILQLKRLKLDSTVAAGKATHLICAIVDRHKAHKIIHHLISQLEDEDMKECVFHIGGELKEDNKHEEI
jgi:hypothetical protein